jgi:hypothetical protein
MPTCILQPFSLLIDLASIALSYVRAASRREERGFDFPPLVGQGRF